MASREVIRGAILKVTHGTLKKNFISTSIRDDDVTGSSQVTTHNTKAYVLNWPRMHAWLSYAACRL